MGERRVRYHLLALAVVLVWGVTFVCTKVLIGAGLHPVDIWPASCRYLLDPVRPGLRRDLAVHPPDRA